MNLKKIKIFIICIVFALITAGILVNNEFADLNKKLKDTEKENQELTNKLNDSDKEEAKWRYYVNNSQVDYDSYVQYLSEQGYTINGNNTLANIDWINVD